MIKMRRPFILPMYSLIFLMLLAAVPGHVLARDPSVAMPEHVGAKRYGTGGECDRGYRAAREDCVPVKIPENADLDYSGTDWECNEPYRKRQGKCARI
jgi:hypothetical protein